MAHKVDAVVIRSRLQELGKTQYKEALNLISLSYTLGTRLGVLHEDTCKSFIKQHQRNATLEPW